MIYLERTYATGVEMMVNTITAVIIQDHQYTASFVPKIKRVSFIRDSFSSTINLMVRDTGYIKAIEIQSPRIKPTAWKNVFLLEAFVGKGIVNTSCTSNESIIVQIFEPSSVSSKILDKISTESSKTVVLGFMLSSASREAFAIRCKMANSLIVRCIVRCPLRMYLWYVRENPGSAQSTI